MVSLCMTLAVSIPLHVCIFAPVTLPLYMLQIWRDSLAPDALHRTLPNSIRDGGHSLAAPAPSCSPRSGTRLRPAGPDDAIRNGRGRGTRARCRLEIRLQWSYCASQPSSISQWSNRSGLFDPVTCAFVIKRDQAFLLLSSVVAVCLRRLSCRHATAPQLHDTLSNAFQLVCSLSSSIDICTRLRLGTMSFSLCKLLERPRRLGLEPARVSRSRSRCRLRFCLRAKECLCSARMPPSPRGWKRQVADDVRVPPSCSSRLVQRSMFLSSSSSLSLSLSLSLCVSLV